MTVHVSFDLETWGTTPGSDIRSIGACVFVPHTGAVCTPEHIQLDLNYPNGTFYVACDNPQLVRYTPTGTNGTVSTYPLTRDPRTVQWWSEQSDEAQQAFGDPIDLRIALLKFDAWIAGLTGNQAPGTASELRIWSHGPAFDVSILSAAYRAVGLPDPCHYRAPRDTRTAFDMAGIEDHSAWLAQHAHGTAHNALDDAICQARAVCGAYEKVREWSDSANELDYRYGGGKRDDYGEGPC